MELKDKITIKVKKCLKEKNLEIEDVAKITGKTIVSIKRKLDLSNKSRRFSIKDIEMFANVLNIFPYELMDFTDIKEEIENGN